MNRINLLTILIISIIIFIFYYNIKYTNEHINENYYQFGNYLDIGSNLEPDVLKLNLKPYEKITFDYLKKEHGNKNIVVSEYSSTLTDQISIKGKAEFKDMLMKNYINYILNDKEKKKRLYLKINNSYSSKKDMDEYNSFPEFKDLSKILLKKTKKNYIKFLKEMKNSPGWYSYNYTFWIGPKGSRTSIHWDSDDYNFLYMIKGRKKIILIKNKVVKDWNKSFEKKGGNFCNLEHEKEFGSCWPGFNLFKDKKIKKKIIILKPGEGLSIPKYYWHAVENLDDTIAAGIQINKINDNNKMVLKNLTKIYLKL